MRSGLPLFFPLLIAVVSCGDGSSPDAYDPHLAGPLMRPGQDCGRCHSDAGGAESGPPWSAAGTIYGTPDADAGDGVAGVVVRLTDSTGRTRETTTNEVGNFWFEEPLEPPLIVELVHAGNTTRMSSPAPSGYCAACHTAVDPLGPPGRVFVP